MSIQDDYYDIKDALKKNKAALKQFEDFATWAFECEKSSDKYAALLNDIKAGLLAAKELLGR